LIGVALISMALKVLVQATVAIPAVAVMALTVRHFVMGFIHMNTLGTMTMLLMAYAVVEGWLDINRKSVRFGLGAIVLGIVLSEVLLFTQGTFFWAGWGLLPGHYEELFGVSVLIPLGVGVLLVQALVRQR